MVFLYQTIKRLAAERWHRHLIF